MLVKINRSNWTVEMFLLDIQMQKDEIQVETCQVHVTLPSFFPKAMGFFMGLSYIFFKLYIPVTNM